MPRTSFLDNESWTRANDLAFDNLLDDGLGEIRFGSMLDDGIKQVTSTLAQPAPQPRARMPMQITTPELDPIPFLEPTPDAQPVNSGGAGQGSAGVTLDFGSATPSGAPGAAPADPSSWEGKAYAAAVKAGHPNPTEFVEQIRWESGNFDPAVIAGTRKSSAGAEGIAQIMRRYHPGVDPLNPDAALDYAARLMKSHYDQYGDSDTALIAYNGGGGAVAAARAGHPYAESQQYLREIKSRVSERAAVAAPETPPTQRAAESRAQSGETRLSRVSYPLQQDLTVPEKWAVCGPLAIMGFAAANGTPIDYETAKAKAAAAGWTARSGMAGPASTVATLKSVGVPATMEAVNWERVKADVRNGNPVMLSSPGASGHYYVVQGVDDQGRLDLGNSAMTLTAARGRRWFTPEELRALGPIGAVDTAIYMDNPSSPSPSHAVAQTKMSPANENAAQIVANRDALALTAGAQSPAGLPSPGPAEILPSAGPPDMLRQSFNEPMDEPLPGAPRYARGTPPPRLETSDASALDIARATSWANAGAVDQRLDGSSRMPKVTDGDEPNPPPASYFPVDMRPDPYYDPEGVDVTNTLIEPGYPPGPAEPYDWYQRDRSGEIYRQPLDAVPPVRDRWADEPPQVPFLPGDGGTAPVPPPIDPDQGPREAIPGTQGAAPIISPMSPFPEPVTPPPAPVVAPTAPPNQITRYVPSYAPQAAQVTPEMAPSQSPLETVVKPVLETLDAANEWVINHPVAGLPNLQGMGREAAGWELISQEIGADTQRLTDLMARYQNGDTSVLPEMQALDQNIKRKLAGMPGAGAATPRDRLLAAGAANPDKSLETVGSIAQGIAATALAPGLGSGVVRNVAAGALDPVGQGLGAAIEAPFRAAEAIPEVGRRIRGALDANAERVAAADARMAAEGSVQAPGVFGISGLTPETPGVQGMRPRVVEQPPLYPAGTPEHAVNTVMRQAAAEAPDGLAHVSGGEIERIPGGPFDPNRKVATATARKGSGVNPVPLNPGGLPSTDDVRAAVDVGLPHKDWYFQIAERAAKIVGEENLPEFFTIFGVTSAQTKVHDNIAATLQVMRSVREMQAQGKPWSEIREALLDTGDQVQSTYKSGPNAGQGRFDNKGKPVMEYTRRPQIPFVLSSMDKRKAIVEGYETGISRVESGAKTSSYAGSFESAGQRVYDPRTTNDIFVWRAFNVTPAGEKVAANDDAAYRTVEAVLNEIAAEKGIPGHNVQAAVWATIKNLWEQAPDLVQDYQSGAKSLSEVIEEGSQRVVDVGGTPHRLFDVPTGQAQDFDRPEVVRVMSGADPSLMRQAGPEKALEMTRQYSGQGEVPRPSNLPFRLQERAVAEGRAPIAAIPMTADELDAAGLDREQGVFSWLTVPHRVDEVGGNAVVHLPGGTSETAQYVAAQLGARFNRPAVIAAPKHGADGVAGVSVRSSPRQIQALAAALREADIPHVVGTTRGVLQIPHLGSDTEAFLGTIQELTGRHGMSPSDLALLTGDVSHATPAEHSRALEALQHTYRSSGPPVVPGRPDGGAGAGSGAAPGAGAPAAGASAPSVGSETAYSAFGQLPPQRPTREIQQALTDEFGRPYPDVRGRITGTHEQTLGDASAEMIRDSRMPRDVVHPDLRGQTMPRVDDIPPDMSERMNAGAGTLPPGAAPDRLGAVNRALSQGIASSVSGGVGAQVNQEMNPDDPYAGLKGFAAGALGPALAARGGRALARRAGAAADTGGGALATLGVAPGGGVAQRFPGVQQAIQASQQRAARMAANPSGPQPLSPLQWTRKAAATLGYSSMIGPSTATVNIFGNLLEPAWAIPKEAARAVARRNPREFTTMAAGSFRGMGQVGTAMKDAIMARGRYASNPDHPMLSEQTVNPLGHAVATVLEAGGRVFSGMPDAIFGTIARSAGEAREAAQIATDMGLKGDKWTSYVDVLLKEADAQRGMKPGSRYTSADAQRVIKGGEEYATRQTFRDELGTVGKGASALAGRNIPVVGNLITPFFNTPWNMGLRSLERSPVGAVMNTQATRFDRHYDTLAGSALLAGLALGPGAAGLITGSGPDDPEKRKMLEAEGWKPYHTLVPWVDGQSYYVPNRVFGIYGKVLNAVGDTHDAMAFQKKDADANTTGSDALRRFGNLIKEEPYLQGLSDILGLVDSQGAADAVNRYAASTATRMVPYGATARAIGTAADPYERDVDRGKGVPPGETFTQRVEQGLGMRSDLPVAQDILGQPKENPQQGLRAVLPKMSTERGSPVTRAYLDAGVDISLSPPDVDGVVLTPDQRRRFQAIQGQHLQELAGPTVSDPSWASTPIAVRAKILETFKGIARKLATTDVKANAGDEFWTERTNVRLKKAGVSP